MPKVPTYDTFNTGATVQPTGEFRMPQRVDYSVQQSQQFSEGLMRAGQAVANEAIDMQREANSLRVDDALNQAKEAAMRLTYDKSAGFMNLRGVDALQRQSGMPLADEYGENLKDQIGRISDSLGNDAQRQAFSMRANDVLTSFRTQAIQHEAGQFREYAMSVREGTIKNRINDIALNYNNPEIVDKGIDSIKAATYDMSRLLGRSAEWAEAQAREMTSKAHSTAIAAALEKNDVGYADSYIKRYGKDMEAGDLLRVQGLVTKEVDSRVALAVASDVMRKVTPQFNPSDWDRVVNITMGAESGGRRYDAQGNLLTSPKGAKGEMQVLDSTNGNPGFGVAPARDNSPEERARVGRDYLAAMVKRYNGDMAKVWAAYNAGPGSVDDAMKKAEKDPTKSWLQLMPAETQGYVNKNLAAYGAGMGAPNRPTLADVHEAVRQQVGTANPQRLKMALDEATRQYEDQDKALKQRDDQNTAQAMQMLVANGGNFNALPLSVRSAIPAKEVDNVIGYAKRIATGADTTDKAVYLKLASDPTYLKNLSDADFYKLSAHLSQEDFKHFSNERSALLTGTGANSANNLNTGAINSVLNDRLRTLGINPNPKPTDTSESMRVGAIQKFVRDSILNAQSVTGKRFTDADVERHVDGLFARSAEFRNTFLGISTNVTRERLLTMKVGDIPGDVKNKLTADFKAAGISHPTDADILGAYWKLKFSQNGR